MESKGSDALNKIIEEIASGGIKGKEGPKMPSYMAQVTKEHEEHTEQRAKMVRELEEQVQHLRDIVPKEDLSHVMSVMYLKQYLIRLTEETKYFAKHVGKEGNTPTLEEIIRYCGLFAACMTLLEEMYILRELKLIPDRKMQWIDATFLELEKAGTMLQGLMMVHEFSPIFELIVGRSRASKNS